MRKVSQVIKVAQVSQDGLPRSHALATQTRSIWEQVSAVRGQSLFEVVVALAIVTLITVAIISLASTSIRNATFARNKTSATRYSQEGSEWLRGQRDSDWTSFAARAAVSPGIKWCLSTLSWPGAAGPCGSASFVDNTIFKREALLSYPDPGDLNNIQADVRTFWTDSQGDHDVKTSTYLSNWRGEQ